MDNYPLMINNKLRKIYSQNYSGRQTGESKSIQQLHGESKLKLGLLD